MKNLCIILLFFIFTQVNIVKAESITLEYNWQPGITSKVDYKFVKVKSHKGKSQNREVKGSYILTTKSHRDGLQIDFSDSTTEVTSSQAGEKSKMESFIQKLSEISPSYIINHKGVLTKAIGIKKIKDNMEIEMQTMFADIPPAVREKMMGFINGMFSEQQIMTQLQQQWNRDVGQWIGGEFEIGYVYTVNYSSPVPFLGNIQIPTIGQYEYFGKTNCNPSSFSKNCVKLNFKSFLDDQSIQTMLSEFFKKIGAKLPESFQLTIDYNVQLITEPKTLKPHKIIETKISTLSSKGSSTPIVRTIENKEKNYSYP